MLYVITGKDAPGALTIRKQVRPEHLAHARQLLAEGRLILAGPCPAVDGPDPGPAGFTGSVIVAEFESLDAARQWVEADPYVTAGVFESWDVRPFLKVLP